MITVPLPSSFGSGVDGSASIAKMYQRKKKKKKKIEKSVIGVNAVQLIAFLLLFSTLYELISCGFSFALSLLRDITHTHVSHFPDFDACCVVSAL